MDRAAKQEEIKNLTDKFQRSIALFIADYKGMNVEQVTTLRKELDGLKDVEMKVVKNTLALRALETQPYSSALADSLVGTNAVIFAYGDPAAPAKTLVKYATDFEHLNIKTGVLKGQKMDESKIKALATLPSREQLIAKVMGSLNAPAQNLVGVMAAVPRSVLNVLVAVQKKKEEAQAS
ncbi:MAG: 50S ribosomal protein L10 [Oligoflexia bacterium]|nr:50S ribosomal protein L10 [Oligoflexia bacterium]